MLDVVVTLFRVYFELNTLRLCKNLSNAVDRLDFNIFPASSRVSYKFYMGRLSIFDNDYVRRPIVTFPFHHFKKGTTEIQPLPSM